MQFEVVYVVDVPRGIDINDFAPPQVEELWDQSDDEGPQNHSYLDSRWNGGSHRKWSAILDRVEFDDFVYRCDLVAEDTETLGSRFGIHRVPSISFQSDTNDVHQIAQVTPILEVERRYPSADDWERVRDAVVAVYGW